MAFEIIFIKIINNKKLKIVINKVLKVIINYKFLLHCFINIFLLKYDIFIYTF